MLVRELDSTLQLRAHVMPQKTLKIEDPECRNEDPAAAK